MKIQSAATFLTCTHDSKSLTDLSAPEIGLCLYLLLAVLETTANRKDAVNICNAICKVWYFVLSAGYKALFRSFPQQCFINTFPLMFILQV